MQQQMTSSESLDRIECPQQQIPNEQKLILDQQKSEYDSNILRVMLQKYQEQQLNRIDMTQQSRNDKENMRNTLKYAFQQIQNQLITQAADMAFSNMLTIQLQAHKFMEIAILQMNQDESYYSFYASCATNMAYKLNIHCIVDCFENYEVQQIQTLQFKTFEFEKNINRYLNWNCQLITASQFFYYFIDYHFSQRQDWIIREGIQQICDKIVDIYLEYQWSAISIALGFLSYIFQQNEEEFDYLCFIIQHYKQEFSQLGQIIDEEQILQVREHLNDQQLQQQQQQQQQYQQQQDYYEDEDDEEEDEEEEQEQLQLQLQIQQYQYQVNQQIQTCQDQKQQYQHEFNNVSSDNDQYYKILSNSSSQTINYEQEEYGSINNIEISYNKKRSSTQYTYQSCYKNSQDQNTQKTVSKSRSYSEQIKLNQDHEDIFESKNGDQIRKKFKQSNDQ
ncbi:hypothetical protein TTHERM_00705230 (macronuclear) [Tetrahymena thermophila SB210]|uniref:Uncharacterized protein n=1 Tax=Tetrahymena thermophila (strain SB210) TaxID=312017 RepID=I7MDP7_TETTS|nr:hypothetical protein TTHERM_00705230 [Tetrahymena thermophila SB210]EAR90707.2 hypothetical protein TTHERM_00705230 [Tetrahymena thermophila SB210]|eukprot:XP_001010952.2 hypothetical protein TTHERM_00705230 [Tetrahymena thermophila SB210]